MTVEHLMGPLQPGKTRTPEWWHTYVSLLKALAKETAEQPGSPFIYIDEKGKIHEYKCEDE